MSERAVCFVALARRPFFMRQDVYDAGRRETAPDAAICKDANHARRDLVMRTPFPAALIPASGFALR